ncbi:MAG: hypothetical protein V1644_03775 [Candidatus Micrarchaeota archaeon]
MVEKKIVIPGEKVSDKPVRMDGCYTANGATFASVMSIMQDEKVVPLKGKYLPIPGDYVVGIVSEERFSSFTIDLNSPYEGQISSRELRDPLRVEDVVFVKIAFVDEVNNAVLADPRRLYGGEILEIEPVKVPRVIGRNMSMVTMIRDYTGTDIFVGKNGRLYLKGKNSVLAIGAILKICRESHTSGLTDRIKNFLEANQQPV